MIASSYFSYACSVVYFTFCTIAIFTALDSVACTFVICFSINTQCSMSLKLGLGVTAGQWTTVMSCWWTEWSSCWWCWWRMLCCRCRKSSAVCWVPVHERRQWMATASSTTATKQRSARTGTACYCTQLYCSFFVLTRRLYEPYVSFGK